MAVAKKGKRKLIYDERIYYWHIVDDGYLGGKEIQIISDDKRLILGYVLLENNQIIIKRDEFSINYRGARRFDFSLEEVDSITPKSIVQILEAYQEHIKNA